MFQKTAVRRISTVLPGADEAQITQLVAGTSSAAYRTLSEPEQRLIIPEVTGAMKVVWIMYAAAAGLSFLCSLPLYVSSWILPYRIPLPLMSELNLADFD